MNIVRFMNEKKINKLIFSSSATVYGDTNVSPIKEIDKIKPINTYGETKVVIENFVKNICNSNSDFIILFTFLRSGCVPLLVIIYLL